MRSLNDMVNFMVKHEWRDVAIDGNHYQSVPVKTILDLNTSMPSIYPVVSDPVFDALGELFWEVNQHSKSQNRKVITELTDNLQRLELLWDGAPLDENVIKQINKSYQKGRFLSKKPGQSGTLRAGYFLGQAGGEVIIENYQNGIYVARNVVTLPIIQ